MNSQLAIDLQLCPSCGEFVSRLIETTGFCRSCSYVDNKKRIEQWLMKNADHVEYYTTQGCSLNRAILLVCDDVRPTCASCGEVIKGARRESVFCRQTYQCKRASRRYVYLYNQKGMSKSEALAQVISELNPLTE